MKTAAVAATIVCMASWVTQAAAQEFGVFLNCKGRLESGAKSRPSTLDLALRRNSQLALIQASDILPAGQRMHLEITPQFYTMVFSAPTRDSVIYYDWLRGALIVWNPQLSKLHQIRMSVDRQSAALDGDLRDGDGASIGRLRMRCEPKTQTDVPEPKF
ncbi:MAG: hypothetical protein HUU30_15305 [Burkholderiaceae bacterium]|nr:hypothetical protein [Aquabacterium sp.]NUP87102.1 hypothetical protein [Burkholderiaceae bacterium]